MSAVLEPWVEHIAGPMKDGLQKCARCGVALVNVHGSRPMFEWVEGQPVYEHERDRYWQAPTDAKIEPCR